MSNITKAFEAKQGLRSANLPGYAGGFVQKLFGGGKPAPAAPAIDPRLAQIEASQRALQQSQGTYGSAPAAVAAPVVSAAPTQQVAPVGVSLSGAVGAIQSRGEALKATAGYKDGRVPVHEGPGIVHGPGTTTSDSVNAKLSKDEAVLPAATVAALGGTEAVAELIERTNGKAPARGLRDGVHANRGVVAYDPLKDPSRAHAPYTPPIEAPRTTQFVQDGVRAGQTGAQSASRPNWIDPTKQVATVTNPPNISDPNVIEGQSRRVPNTGTTVATVDGQGARTANVDRMTQADYARGMRNGQAAAGAAPVTTATPAQPLPRGEQFGRDAAKVYQDVGGVKGMAGKAMNAVVPAMAAYSTMGEDGIRVEGNREGDATNESASGVERVINAAKEIGLRAGDWGTKGADMLMDLPLWAANKMGATSDGKPLEYGLINKNYRQGMRDANLAGVTIPQSAPEREMTNAKAVSPAANTGYDAKEAARAKAVTDVAATAAADKAKAVTLAEATAAASKAGSFPGQNRIPEAVTVQDQAASDMMGKKVDKLTGVSSTGDQGVRGMAQRMDSYANNESARQARNEQLKLRGDGARYEKDGNGKLWIKNSGDFDGSTKMPYTGADGKPTAVFAGSMENQRGIADAKGMRKQLANIEQMNLKRNAQDDITDVGLRTYSRGVLKDQAAQNAKYNETLLSKQPSQLDLIKDDRDERKFQNDINNVAQMQRNNVRDYKAKQTEYMAKRSQTLLDNLFPTAGLKDDALKSAKQNRSDAEVALYAAAKSMPANDDEFDKAVPAMESQMRLTMAHKKAMQDQGIWQKLRNAGRDPITTLVSMQPKIVGDDFVYENGYKLPTKLVLGNDPALLAAHNARVNAK